MGSEERVQRAEQAFDFLVTLVRDGIAAAWQRIVEFVGNLQEMVIGGIRDWVARTVVGQAIARLVTLFNPAGAVIQAIMAIYNTIVFFIERAQQISAVVESVFGSIASIAAGNIGAAALIAKGYKYFVDKDADHVLDLSWHGQDEFDNLWPLDREVNQRPVQDNWYSNYLIQFKAGNNRVQVKPLGQLDGKWFKILGYQYPPPNPGGKE